MNDGILTVLDAGPVIHLDELRGTDLLKRYRALILTPKVIEEIRRHRPDALSQIEYAVWQNVPAPSARMRQVQATLALDAGEAEALCLAEAIQSNWVLTDDATARAAAELLGLPVRGTLGVIVDGVVTGTCSRRRGRALLRAIPGRSSLFVSSALLTAALARLG